MLGDGPASAVVSSARQNESEESRTSNNILIESIWNCLSTEEKSNLLILLFELLVLLLIKLHQGNIPHEELQRCKTKPPQ